MTVRKGKGSLTGKKQISKPLHMCQVHAGAWEISGHQPSWPRVTAQPTGFSMVVGEAAAAKTYRECIMMQILS